MKSFAIKAGVVLALAVMVTSAFAQGGGGGNRGGRGGFGGQRGMMGGGVSETQLLNRKDVQAELKITSEQKTKAEAALQKLQEDRRAARQNGGGGGNFQDMTDEERAKMRADREKQNAKYAEEDKKALEAVLTKEQITRLHELYIQRLGNSIITRPEFQKELNVTDEQKKKISDLQTQQREAMMNGGGGMGNFQDMTQEERQAAMQKMQETMRKNQEIMNTKLGELMTQEQKDKLKAMGGAAFKFDPAEDNNRGGRGGGGRGGF